MLALASNSLFLYLQFFYLITISNTRTNCEQSFTNYNISKSTSSSGLISFYFSYKFIKRSSLLSIFLANSTSTSSSPYYYLLPGLPWWFLFRSIFKSIKFFCLVSFSSWYLVLTERGFSLGELLSTSRYKEDRDGRLPLLLRVWLIWLVRIVLFLNISFIPVSIKLLIES